MLVGLMRTFKFFIDPSYYLDRETAIEKLGKQTDTTEKALKLTSTVLDTLAFTTKTSHPDVSRGSVGYLKAVKAARDINGQFNVLFASRRIGGNLIVIFRLLKRTNPYNDNIALTRVSEGRSAPYNLQVCTRKEQFLALTFYSANLLAQSTYFFGFAVSKTFGNLEKYAGVKLGKTTHKVAEIFPDVMAANRVGTIIMSIAGLFMEQIMHDRALQDTENNDDRLCINREFTNRRMDHLLTGFGKVLDLGAYVIGKVNKNENPHAQVVKFALQLTACSLDIAKIARRYNT